MLLKEEINESTNQKRKLLDTAEDWCTKTKKLHNICEVEKLRVNELEERVQEYEERCEELQRILESTTQELVEKDEFLRNLTNQITNVEREFNEKSSLCKSLQIETSNLSEEVVKLRAEVKESKQVENQTQFRAVEAEERVKQLTLEAEDYQRQIKRQNVNLENLDQHRREIESQLVKMNSSHNKINKEKIETQKNLERALKKVNTLRQSISKIIKKKVEVLKNEAAQAKNYYKASTSDLIKENEAKILELTNFFISTLRKEKESLANKLQSEFDYQYEGLKEKNNRIQKDMKELYEQKCEEKDRNIKYLQETNNKMNEKARELKEDYERLQMRYVQVQDEKERIFKEKEELNFKLEDTRQQFVTDVNNFNIELEKSSQEFMTHKIILQSDYQTQISDLLNEIDRLKEVNKETLTKYQNEIQELIQRNIEKVADIDKKAKVRIHDTLRNLEESRLVEQELANQVLNLQEKLSKVENRNEFLETEVIQLQQKEEDYLSQYEIKMAELKTMIEKDNERVNIFKMEKFKEISQQKSKLAMLEREIVIKDEKISHLIKEKESLKKQIQEGESRKSLKENYSQNTYSEGKEVGNERTLQSKETTKLRFVASENLPINTETFHSPKNQTIKKLISSDIDYEPKERKYKYISEKSSPIILSHRSKRAEEALSLNDTRKSLIESNFKTRQNNPLKIDDINL